MEHGNAKEGEGSWTPVTPAKHAPVKLSESSIVEKQRKSLLGSGFLSGKSTKNAFNVALAGFNAMSSCDQGRCLYSCDGTLDAKEEQTSSGRDTRVKQARLMDLNSSICSWKENSGSDLEVAGYSSKRLCKALDMTQEAENPCTRLASIDLTGSPYSFGGGFSVEEALNGKQDLGARTNVADDWDAPLASIPFIELLGLCDAAPLTSHATNRTTQAAVDEVSGSFFPVSRTQVCSSLQKSTGSILPADHGLSVNPNATNSQETEILHCDRPSGVKDEKKREVPSVENRNGNLQNDDGLDLSGTLNPFQKHNNKKRHIRDLDLNKKPGQRPQRKKHRPKVVVEGKPKRTPKPKTPRPVTPKKKDQSVERKKNNFKAASTHLDDSSGEAINTKPECPKTPKPVTPKLVKRRYVRKNSLKDTSIPLENVSGEAMHPISEEVEKSCKLALNFEMESHSTNDSLCNNYKEIADTREKIVVTRDYCPIIDENDSRATNQTGCRYNSLPVYQRIFRANQCLYNSRKLGPNFPKICKKKRIRRRQRVAIFGFLWSAKAIKHCWRLVKSSIEMLLPQAHAKIKKKRWNRFIPRRDLSYLSPLKKEEMKPSQDFLLATKLGSRCHITSQDSISKCKLLLNLPRLVNPTLKRKRGNKFIPRRDLAYTSPLKQVPCHEPHSVQLGVKACIPDNAREMVTYSMEPFQSDIHGVEACTPDNNAGKMVTYGMEPSQSDKIWSETFKVQESLSIAKLSEGCNKTSSDSQELIPNIDFITQRLNCLNISNGDVKGPHSSDGTLVPYLRKIHQTKPKVDLDQETIKMWKLLTYGDDREGVEHMADKKKEKWWKAEREVFRGRADAFIARMHLIQGNGERGIDLCQNNRGKPIDDNGSNRWRDI